MNLFINIIIGAFLTCTLLSKGASNEESSTDNISVNKLRKKSIKKDTAGLKAPYIVEKVQSQPKIEVQNLRCNYRLNPMAIGDETPQLSWQIISNLRNITQSAYHILVSDDKELLEKNTGNVWNSERTLSNQSLLVKYQGEKLLPGKKYYWKVKVWDKNNRSTHWSEPASWQTGIFSKEDWKNATWIGRKKKDSSHKNLPILRKGFNLKKTVEQATIYISGLGHFELSLNGKKIGNHFLDPGWTDYDEHAQYVSFDVTRELKNGANAMGVMLGNGFYNIPSKRYRKFTDSFGNPKLICRLLIQFEDGTSEDIISDPTWKTSSGPIIFTSIYGGEDYDARLEQEGWDQPYFDDTSWESTIEVKGPGQLDPQIQEPLKILDQFERRKVTQPESGVWIYDMGQNASGIPRISVSGIAGETLKITPGELLDDTGMVTQKASGGPSYFVYTLKGADKETWEPRFTYYGFRYLQIEGAVPKDRINHRNLPVLEDISTLHTRNSARKTGDFRCSYDLFNKIYDLIGWSIKSNMASVFTDCPHREKLGWLEVAHLMGSSIRYNYNIATFLKKIISDMRYAQLESGLIPDIAPEYVEFDAGFRDSPEWGSSGVILPWYLYKWYGDKRSLEKNYPMMEKYVTYLTRKAEGHILSYGLGDWYDIGPERVGESQLTPKGVTATAIYYYDLKILTKIAKLLGKSEDTKRYSELGKKVKEAFNNKFFNKRTKQYATGSQTSNAMAVFMKLVEPEDKEAVVANLVKDIRNGNNRITAGDVGFRYVLRVLENENRSDVIYDMNSRSDVPGYGYQLARGATSLTESWQAYRYVSNNHMMLGHLMEWFYSGLAGIRAADDAIAFNKIDIHPEPIGDIKSAKAVYNSPYGPIRSEWNKDSTTFKLHAEIPPNTTATVYLPSSSKTKILESGKEINNISIKRTNFSGRTVIKIGSGKYNFLVKSE